MIGLWHSYYTGHRYQPNFIDIFRVT